MRLFNPFDVFDLFAGMAPPRAPALVDADSRAMVRFLAKVDRSAGSDACHAWAAATNRFGYGIFGVHNRSVLAHRWIVEQTRGARLGPDDRVLHRCDNPPCVNPQHLYVGDQAQNMRDCVERGRYRNVVAQAKSARTHCLNGHEFNEENTRHRPGRGRECRACQREQRRARARKAAQ